MSSPATARPPDPGRKSNATVARIRCDSSGIVEALVERPQPAALRHPPQPLTRQDAVVVDADPTARESRVDVRAEPLEVGIDLASWPAGGSAYASALSWSEASVNSRRAALPKSSHAQARGAAPLRQIEKSTSRETTASCWRLSTRPKSRGGTPARDEQQEQPRQVLDRADEAILVGGTEDHVPQRDRAARIEPEQVAGGQQPDHAVGVEHRDVLAAGREHVDRRLDRELPGGDRRHRRTRDLRDRGSSAPSPAATAARTSASVTIPSSPPLRSTSSAVTPGAPSRSAASDGRVGVAEDRRAHDRRDRRRSHVEQAVDGVPGAVSRLRIDCATYAAPASVPSTRRPAAAASSEQLDGSCARTLNAGAIPVSSDGCPNTRPARGSGSPRPRGRSPSSRSAPPTGRRPGRRPRRGRPPRLVCDLARVRDEPRSSSEVSESNGG